MNQLYLMKLTLRLVTGALLGAFSVPLAHATQYTIDWMSLGESYDYEFYKFEYIPGVGWSRGVSVGGENSFRLTDYTVFADDGSVGQTVDLEFTVNYVMTARPLDLRTESHGPLPLDWDAEVANFAGFESGDLSTTLSAYTRPPAWTTPVLITSHSLDATGFVTINNLPAVVGYDSYLQVFPDPSIVPTGMHVIDPTKPAGFGLWVETDAFVTGLKVAEDVPDGCSTLALLLGISLPALAVLRLRYRRAAAGT